MNLEHIWRGLGVLQAFHDRLQLLSVVPIGVVTPWSRRQHATCMAGSMCNQNMQECQNDLQPRYLPHTFMRGSAAHVTVSKFTQKPACQRPLSGEEAAQGLCVRDRLPLIRGGLHLHQRAAVRLCGVSTVRQAAQRRLQVAKPRPVAALDPMKGNLQTNTETVAHLMTSASTSSIWTDAGLWVQMRSVAQ